MTTLKEIYQLFTDYSEKELYPTTKKIFRMAIYGWVLINTIILLPAADHFYGEMSYILPIETGELDLWQKFHYLLHYPNFESFYPTVIALQLIFAILALSPRFAFAGSLLTYISTMLLDGRAYPIQDGGNNLMHLLLFYAIFILPLHGNESKWWRSIKIPLGNIFLLACKLQVITVYLMAGLLKITGNLWPRGVALYYTFQVDEYSHPLLKQLMLTHPIFSILGSYVTIAFQLSFPYLIWFKRTKGLMTFIGSCLHLGIAFGMGLMSFGFAMTVSYLCFLDEERARGIWRFLFGDRLIVAFDSQCSKCMQFARIMKRVDIFKKIVIDDSRIPITHEIKMIPASERNHSLHLYQVSTGKIISGWPALQAVILATPFRLILKLPLSFLTLTGFGHKIYNNYILKTKWRKTCEAGLCEI